MRPGLFRWLVTSFPVEESRAAGGDERGEPLSLSRAVGFSFPAEGSSLKRFFWRLVVCSAFVCFVLGRAVAVAESNLPLLLKDDFEQGNDRWQTTDPNPASGVWKLIEVGKPGNHALRVTGTSKYQPPHRSPHSIAFLKDVVVGDFDLTVRVQETNVSAGPHRDLCIFWGYQDPAKFYYVHFARKRTRTRARSSSSTTRHAR